MLIMFVILTVILPSSRQVACFFHPVWGHY